MKLSNTTLLSLLSASLLVDAAPAPAPSPDHPNALILSNPSVNDVAVSKRDTLVKAMADFNELKVVRAKRSDLDAELTTREYAIVTQVLTAIKDTELTPKILKFFVSNDVLKSAAISGVEYVIKSGLLSLKNLLQLLVQSGLITDVLNDVLGNCEVYASLINIAKGLLSNLLKREDLGLDLGVAYDGDLAALKRDVEHLASAKRQVPYSHEEAYEMLRRDGIVENSELSLLLDAVKRDSTSVKSESTLEKRELAISDSDSADLDARDVDDIVVNVLESLADSGLASQVVETVLTDSDFVVFAAALVKKLYEDGLISVSALVSAVTQSGLLPALIKELLNFSTLTKIATTALAAFDGKCSAASGNSTSTDTGSGGSLVGSLLSSLTDSSDSSDSKSPDSKSSDTKSGSESSGSGILGLASSLLGGGSLLSGLLGDQSTTTATTDACSTQPTLLRRGRLY